MLRICRKLEKLPEKLINALKEDNSKQAMKKLR